MPTLPTHWSTVLLLLNLFQDKHRYRLAASAGPRTPLPRQQRQQPTWAHAPPPVPVLPVTVKPRPLFRGRLSATRGAAAAAATRPLPEVEQTTDPGSLRRSWPAKRESCSGERAEQTNDLFASICRWIAVTGEREQAGAPGTRGLSLMFLLP